MNRGTLQYLEIHIVDHCNLNCKGCSHFSPLSPPKFIDVKEFEEDLHQLKNHIIEINQLRLMGGEPLLHPNLVEFLTIARKIYPNNNISLVSNGILIPSLKKNVLKTLNKLNIRVDLTIYPTKKQNLEEYLTILNNFGVASEIVKTDMFYQHISLNNSRDKNISFKDCRSHFYCPALKQGKLYQCSGLAYIHLLFKHFNIKSRHLPEGLNIYNSKIDFNEIIKFINTPDSSCENCFYGSNSYKWEISKKEMSEWIIN